MGAFVLYASVDSGPRILSFPASCRSNPRILSVRAILPEPEGREPRAKPRGARNLLSVGATTTGGSHAATERRLSRILRDMGFHNSIPLGTWDRDLRPLLVHTSVNRQPTLSQQMPGLPILPILLPRALRREVDRKIRPPHGSAPATNYIFVLDFGVAAAHNFSQNRLSEGQFPPRGRKRDLRRHELRALSFSFSWTAGNRNLKTKGTCLRASVPYALSPTKLPTNAAPS